MPTWTAPGLSTGKNPSDDLPFATHTTLSGSVPAEEVENRKKKGPLPGPNHHRLVPYRDVTSTTSSFNVKIVKFTFFLVSKSFDGFMFVDLTA